MEDGAFVDRAWRFFVRFDRYSRSVESSDGDEDIRESLLILLSTIPGERFLEPEYGCDLSPLAFNRLNLSLETQIINDIKRAINHFEPRVDVRKVYIESEDSLEGCIKIVIEYSVRKTGLNYILNHLYNWGV